MINRGVRCVASLAIVALAIAVVGWAGVPGTDLWVPSLARVHGAHGSQWYATVWIHNPGTQAAQVRVSFLARNQSNPTPIQQTVVVNAGETLKLGDVFQDLFGLSSAKGALRFQSDRKVVVSARSYNLTEAGVADSQGQFLAGMPSELALAAGEKTSIPGITQPADGSFRCNYALVETAGGTANVQVTLYDADGMQQASKQYTLAPYEPMQFNLSDMVSGLTVDGGRMDVEVLSGNGKVLAFASMVGNGQVSQDPSTLEMEYELEQGSGGTGLTQVAHDATLAGDGTPSSPLGVADGGITSAKIANGAVTTAKISGSGASSGQVLKFNGSAVSWAADEQGGLTLPFSGFVYSDSPAFSITELNEGQPAMLLYGKLAAAPGGAGTSPLAVDHVMRPDDVPPLLAVATEQPGRGAASFEVQDPHNSAPAVEAYSAGDMGVFAFAKRQALIGNCSGDSAVGVSGWVSSSTGSTIGVKGESSSTSGRGVYGHTTASTGQTYAVYGRAESTSGRGVWGYAPASSGSTTGVWGEVNSPDGRGVYGKSTGQGVALAGYSESGLGLHVVSNQWVAAQIDTPSNHTALVINGGAGGGDLIKAYKYGTSDIRFRVSSTGEVYADGTFHGGGADFAEMYPAKGELAPGTVVGIGEDGRLEAASAKRPRAVMGVVSDNPTIVGGAAIEAEGDAGKVPVAILGIVDVQASAASGPIRPGDLLCAGSQPGTAEKAVWAYPGTIIGKALEALPSGTGKIRMLVTLR